MSSAEGSKDWNGDLIEADKIRKSIKPHLDAVAEIMTQAGRQNLVVSFNIATDQQGNSFAQPVSVVRRL